jgi:EAL and modified HD-GYP domain-containing signal transduction protein
MRSFFGSRRKDTPGTPAAAGAARPEDSGARPSQVYVGRQPILSNDQKLFSYELLFRQGPRSTTAQVVDDVQATTQVLVNTFNRLGVERVLGEKRAFINISAGLLHNDIIESLPADKVVLEILENVEPTPAVVERCRALHVKGFKIALDDFTYRPELEPLLAVASFVKLDIRALGLAATAEHVAKLRGRSLRLIAEKVETAAEFHALRGMMFNHYQGYYFARPETLSGKNIDPSTRHVIQLFNLVAAHAEPKEIEKAFKQDVALTYNLLRYINSVGFGLTSKVDTVGRALVVLGHSKLARWLSLLLMSGGKDTNLAPHALFRTTLTRARLMESLARERLPVTEHDFVFLTGMLSLLDAMLDQPLDRLLAEFTLPEAVRAALLQGQGRYAPYLALARACESFDLPVMDTLTASLGLDPERVNNAHMEALAWTESVSAAV